MLQLFLPVLALLASPKLKPYVKTDHLLLQKIKESSDGVVWVDLENVRGRSGFELAHMDALERTALWTEYHNLPGKVIFVADHGSEKCGYYLERQELAVVFSGPSEKADDVIANGVSFFGRSIVITADNELQSRCRRSSRDDLHIMDPGKFLDDLELARSEIGDKSVSLDSKNYELESMSLDEQIKLGKLDDEIKLRGQLLDLEIQLGKKKKMTNKRRKKLKSKIDNLRSKLALRGPSLLDQVTSCDTSTLNENRSIDLFQQELLLSRWKQIQNRSPRREQTGDRIVYAEQLRRRLDDSEESIKNFNISEIASPVQKFVMQMNNLPTLFNAPKNGQTLFVNDGAISPPYKTTYNLLKSKETQNKGSDTLKLVVLSDTHGFERQILNKETMNDILPDGDALIHLGDFAFEGSYEDERNGLQAFDTWLAKQPHPYKIVVRGNHDPWAFDFPISGAWYVTKPETVSIGQFDIAIVPYGSPRKLSSSGGIPSSCDIIATHLPPFKTLDRTYSGKNVGSSFLVNIVRSMKDNAPKLWLCGHIHEARGVAKRRFGSKETTVVNAANANPGRATHLEHGAMVIQVNEEKADIKIDEMEDLPVEKLSENAQFFEESPNKVNELLMAVDVGLKSGVALFDRRGALLRYEQFLFDRKTLAEETSNLIRSWEETVNREMRMDSPDQEKPWKVTHLAVEGADVQILSAWTEAAPDVSILRVSPEEWRSSLLLPKEKTSGSSSKAASRLVARQIVGDFGTMESHKGKFKTDMAESVVMGYYVVRKLGWIQREPAVRRYTNGVIMVPR